MSSSYSWLKDFFSVCFDQVEEDRTSARVTSSQCLHTHTRTRAHTQPCQDIREEVERGNRFSASLKVLSRVIERAGVRTTFYAGADKGLDWLSEKITSVLQSTEWLSWMTKQHAMVVSFVAVPLVYVNG